MTSKIFQALFEEKTEYFKNSFFNSKELFWDKEEGKLFHPGEFGTYRERIAKEFLQFFIPGQYAIDSGFVISANNEISNQCDLVIFDKQSTPLIQSLSNILFFPVETVLGVGEIKSSIQSKTDLINALKKLADVKKIREGIKNTLWERRAKEGKFDPKNYSFDQIFTFLICKEFKFNLKSGDNNSFGLYESETLPRHRHNLILSVEDGILLYHNGEFNYCYPTTNKKIEKEIFLHPSDDDRYSNFRLFVSYLLSGLKFGTILSPDLALYLDDNVYLSKGDNLPYK